MAGNGGFKNALNGFDKNEVNAYIGEMSKKIQEREAEIKDKEAKAAAAEKAAAEAEAKLKALEETHAAKVSELETQVKTERRNSDTLQNEVDELKRKLRNAGSSAANTAAAEKRAAEIVEKANATARDTVEKAKRTAQQIIAKAESAGGAGVSAASAAAFGDILGKLTAAINDALKTASERASSISVAEGGAPVHTSVEIPDFSDIAAPQAAVPAGKPAKPAPKEVGDVDDVFADIMDDGGEMTDFGDMKPIDPAKPTRGSVDAFDLTDTGDMSTTAAPPKKEESDISMDDLGADLFAQAASDGGSGVEMFGAGESDDMFSDGGSNNGSGIDSAESGLDAMNALLGQMGAVLESAGGSMDDFETGGSVPESDNLHTDTSSAASDDNPWADFQSQIEAMEAGGFGSVPESEAPAADTSDDPKVPDADDSSIWNFDDNGSGGDDDMNSGSDDDMTSDLFGSF